MGVRSSTFLTACFCFLIALPVLGPTHSRYFAGTLAAAEQVHDRSRPDLTVEKLMVGRPQWRRGSGLVYGTMALTNENAYAVKNVTIGCDFFDEWGNQIATKGVALRRPIPPGRTRFSGIQFPISVRSQQGGACRTLAADRMETDGGD